MFRISMRQPTVLLKRLFSNTIKPAGRVETVLQEGNVFASFTALANEHEAMNLGQGFPSFGAPPFLSSLLSEVCKGDAFTDVGPENLNNQYTKPGEEPNLSNTLANIYGNEFNKELDPSNICTTVGAQEGIFTTMAAFCNPGDEIVVITPCFDAYFKSASVLGLRMKGVPLTQTSNMSSQNPSASDFTVNLDTLRSTLSQDTKLLLLNTPASPLGKVFTENELRGISELVTKEFPGLLVLSDEVYEYMTFDNKPHLHIANQPGMWERTISIFSIGKSFSCTGWRLGYAIAPSSLIHTIKTLHSVINFSATTPVQMATAKALDIAVKINYKRWLQDLLQGKRDTFCGALNAMGINFVMPEGGYFVVADMSPYYKEAGITEKSLSCLTPSTPLDDRPDVVFCKWLTREVGVAGIPMSPFYTPELRHLANNHLRFAYCKDSATLNTAVERLQKKFGQV